MIIHVQRNSDQLLTPRVDAQASSTRTGIGGWLPVLNHKGIPDPYCSPWYGREITAP